jgi:hypothetical protein
VADGFARWFTKRSEYPSVTCFLLELLGVGSHIFCAYDERCVEALSTIKSCRWTCENSVDDKIDDHHQIARTISPMRSVICEKARLILSGLNSSGVRRYSNETKTPNTTLAKRDAIMLFAGVLKHVDALKRVSVWIRSRVEVYR